MLILALDTSTRSGSLALAEGPELVAAHTGDADRLHATRLPGALADLLAAHGRTLGDVDRLAVLSGPGGFTGLRVGLATIQGLAFALDREVYVASTLEVLAWAAHRARPDAPLLGAWMRGMRGEVFSAIYRPADTPADAGSRPTGLVEVLPPSVGTPAEVAALWPVHVNDALVAVAGDAWAGDGAVLDAAVPGCTLVPVDAPPLAGLLAMLAAHPAAVAVTPHAVAPTYVRRPDAVLTRERAGLAVPELP